MTAVPLTTIIIPHWNSERTLNVHSLFMRKWPGYGDLKPQLREPDLGRMTWPTNICLLVALSHHLKT